MTAPSVPWGVGQWVDPAGRRRPWTISHDEMHRDMGSASRALAGLGVTKGRRVVWTSMLSEAGQFWPFIVGTMLSGAQLSCADATAAEASRVRMFCRQLGPYAVLGITPELLDGLAELGADPADVFGAVAVLGARPGAFGRLRAAGLDPTWLALAGPAVAVAPAPGEPAHVDTAEWHLDTGSDGYVLVTALRPRATSFDRTPVGVRGNTTSDRLVPEE